MKEEKEKEKEELVRKLIIFGGVVFVFLSILIGFFFLGFFDLIK